MRPRNYGIYHQGARFTDEDFDAIKLIKHYLEAFEIFLSERSFQKLQERQFDAATASELCDAFSIDMPAKELADYSFLCSDLLEERTELFYVGDGETSPFRTEHMYGVMYTDLDGEFYLEGQEESEELGECVMMLAFPVRYVWNQAANPGPKNRQQAVEMLREAGSRLLRDDIDWDKRLGHLIASDYC